MILSEFQTDQYSGVWFTFQDRLRLRAEIEDYLRLKLSDQSGMMVVDENGPHYIGQVSLKGLSYSHTGEVAILVYSFLHELGVDVEKKNRMLTVNFKKIAQRFFHESEKNMKDQAEFLTLFMQKEAYAKLSRAGLSRTIASKLSDANVLFIKTPKIPIYYESWVVIR